MRRDELLATQVVQPALLAPVNTTHSHPVRLVEMGGSTVMLQLSVLNDEPVARPIPIDRQPAAGATLPSITQEPVEEMLSSPNFSQDLVTQLEDVSLVARFSPHADHRSGKVICEPPTLRSTLRPPPGRIKAAARHCVMAYGQP